MNYPTDLPSCLAYAARLTESRRAPFVAMHRPPPPVGYAYAAVPADEVADFEESGWRRVPKPTLLNLTPDPVTMYGVTLPPSGQVASVETILAKHPLSSLLPVPLATRCVGVVSGLPPSSPLQFYIVTPDVAELVKRPDCLTVSPNALIQPFPCLHAKP